MRGARLQDVEPKEGNVAYPTVLPPIVSPSGSSTGLTKQLSSSLLVGRGNGYNGNVRRAVEWNDAPGQLAALWSRTLPKVGLKGMRTPPKSPPRHVPPGAAEALLTVQSHLADVQDALSRKQPSRLEEALKWAQGTGHLKAVQHMRKSRSTSDLHRHALESALATHIVKAKTTLAKWKMGVQEIEDARRLRDVDALESRLDHWKFDDGEPCVQAARADLERYARLESTMPGILKDSIDARDTKALRAAMKELSTGFPRTGLAKMAYYSEARELIRKYDVQEKALSAAVVNRHSKDLDNLVQEWDFKHEDPIYVNASDLLDTRDRLRQELLMQTSAYPPNGPLLRAAVEAWDFDVDAEPEERDEEFVRGWTLLSRFEEACSELEDIVAACAASPAVPAAFAEQRSASSRLRTSKRLADLGLLRDKVDAWEFTTGSDNGCPALREAEDLLLAFEDAIKEAVAAADGWALHRMWTLLGSSLPLKGLEIAPTVVQLLDERAKAAEVLLTTVTDALTAEPGSGPHMQEVEHRVAAWNFDEADPVMRYATTWLRLQRSIGDRSAAELASASRVGSAVVACGALARRQCLAEDDPVVKEAVAVVEAAAEAHRMAAWLALGTPFDQADASDSSPPPCDTEQKLPDDAIARTAAGKAMVGNKLAVAMWKATGGSLDELEACVQKANEHEAAMQVVFEDYRSRIQALLGPHPQQDGDQPSEGLLRRAQRCIAALADLSRSSGKRVAPIQGIAQEVAVYFLANTATRSEPSLTASIVQEMARALETVGNVLSDVYDVLRWGEDAPVGLPEPLRGLGRERPLLCGAAEPPPVSKLNWALQLAVPLESISMGVRVLATTPKDCKGLEEVTEFVKILQSYYEDFLPAYTGLSSSATALEDATAVAEAAKLAFQAVPVADFFSGDVFQDIVFPALTVHRFGSASASAIVQLLTQPPPADAKDDVRLKWTMSALECGLQPVKELSKELSTIAEHLQVGEIIAQIHDDDSVAVGSPVVALLNIVASIVPEPEAAHPTLEPQTVKQRFDAEALGNALKGWSPLAVDDVGKRLEGTGARLVPLWDWYTAGCDGCPQACALFVWAALAGALLPVLDSARALAPAHDAIAESVERIGAVPSQTDACAAWANARLVLHDRDPDTPWWWLELLGCTDAQQFYLAHGFALEADSSSPEELAEAIGDDNHANECELGDYSADFTPMSPIAQNPDATILTSGKEDGYASGFEDDAEDDKPQHNGETTLETEERLDASKAEGEEGYSFEADESPGGIDANAAPASPGSPSGDFGDSFEDESLEQPAAEQSVEDVPQDSSAVEEQQDDVEAANADEASEEGHDAGG